MPRNSTACGQAAAKRRVRDDGWRLPDTLWAEMEPLLPPRPRHPLGCHNPRVPDRAAMDGIFFMLRTGCQWNALRETKLCSSCLDKGFDYDEPRALAKEFGFTLHLQTRGEEARAKRHAKAKARRWWWSAHTPG